MSDNRPPSQSSRQPKTRGRLVVPRWMVRRTREDEDESSTQSNTVLGGSNGANREETSDINASSATQAQGSSSTSGSAPASTSSTRDYISQPQSTTTSTTTTSRPRPKRGYIMDDDRMYIVVDGEELQPASKVAKKLRESIEERTDSIGHTWKGVTDETRDYYWNEFEKKFYWDSAIGELVKKAYKRKMGKTYSQFVYRTKKEGVRPRGMTGDVWDAWKKAWGTQESKDKSKQAKLNRQGGTAAESGPAIRHTTGSISQIEHREKFRDKGINMNPHTLFIYTHTADHDGENFIDNRSRAVHERVEELREEMRQQSTQIDELALYYDAVGGRDKRSRVYGLGYGAGYYSSQRFSRGASSSQSTPHQMISIEEQLRCMQEQVNELVEDRVRAQSVHVQMHEHMQNMDQTLLTVAQSVRDLTDIIVSMRSGQSSNSSFGPPSS